MQLEIAPPDCTACPLHQTRKQVVQSVLVGQGPHELLVVGEGPGAAEDNLGEPFVGPSGYLLRNELRLRGVESYALANATRCFPGTEDKRGLAQGLRACNSYLRRDLEILRPKAILALGEYALRALGFKPYAFSPYVGHVLEREGIPVVVSFHPAAILRNPGDLALFERAVLKARLLLEGARLGRCWAPELTSKESILWATRVVLDCETDHQDALLASPVLVQATSAEGTVLLNPQDERDVELLRELWVNPSVEKCFQNAGYDIKVLERFLGAEIRGFAWDTMLAECLLHEEQTHYDLPTLRGYYTDQPVYEERLMEYLAEPVEVPAGKKARKVKRYEEAGVYKSGKKKGQVKLRPYTTVEMVDTFRKLPRKKTIVGYGDVPREILEPYGAYDAQTTYLVWQAQEQQYTPKQRKLLQEVVLPARLALVDMERAGVKVNLARVEEMRAYYIKERERLAQLVQERAGTQFKVSSADAVRRVLYEELHLPEPPDRLKSKKGPSVGKQARDWLKGKVDHPVLEALEEYAWVSQLIKTFLGEGEGKTTGLMSKVYSDGRLHTTYNMNLETGRNSSSPNLQNLPAENKGPIRELLVAEEGNVLLTADYSQIELRCAAYLAGDGRLTKMLEEGKDVHTAFARTIWPIDQHLDDKAWKLAHEMKRRTAKAYTFGKLFGQSTEGVEFTLGVDEETARRLDEVYAELFPQMPQWWEEITSKVKAGLPIETPFGRQRRFPLVRKMQGSSWRGFAPILGHMVREGLNFLPQATAADIMNAALARVWQRRKQGRFPAAGRLVVHDSLTVECQESQMMRVARELQEEMERVPLELLGWRIPVEVKAGRTWAAEWGTLL